MCFKSTMWLPALFIFLLSFHPGFASDNLPGSETLPIPGLKIKINGHSQYLGYLNAYLNVTRAGRPVNGLKIFLDKLQLSDRGGGIYSGGTPYSYNIKPGNVITIRLQPSPLVSPRDRKSTVLATYKVNNVIQWVYPKPDGVITLGRPPSASLLGRSIKFQWNYTGRTRKTKVTIKDFSKNVVIFSTTVMAESVMVPRSKFVPGRKYRFDLEVDGAMGKFVLTNNVQPGSEVLFYYWAHMYFTVSK